MKRWLQESRAKVLGNLAQRSSRQGGWFDRLCRRFLSRALELPADNDFMRDEWIDNDSGYDADELDRYQRGG